MHDAQLLGWVVVAGIVLVLLTRVVVAWLDARDLRSHPPTRHYQQERR